MKPVYRSRTVFINIPATAAGTVIAFPDQPDLKKGAKVTAFETIVFDDLSTTPNGTTIAAPDASNVLLTLSEGSDERVQKVPYLSANARQNSGQLREVQLFSIEWTQCQLQTTAAIAAPCVAVLIIHYYYPSDINQA